MRAGFGLPLTWTTLTDSTVAGEYRASPSALAFADLDELREVNTASERSSDCGYVGRESIG